MMLTCEGKKGKTILLKNSTEPDIKAIEVGGVGSWGRLCTCFQEQLTHPAKVGHLK